MMSNSLLIIHNSLLAVQFHDELFLNIFRHTFSFRIGNERSVQISFIPIQPAKFLILSANLAGNRSIALAFFLEADDIAWLQLKRRNIHYFTIYSNMFVAYQLAC